MTRKMWALSDLWPNGLGGNVRWRWCGQRSHRQTKNRRNCISHKKSASIAHIINLTEAETQGQ